MTALETQYKKNKRRPTERRSYLNIIINVASFVDHQPSSKVVRSHQSNLTIAVKALSTIIEGINLQYAGSLTTRTSCTRSFRLVDTKYHSRT